MAPPDRDPDAKPGAPQNAAEPKVQLLNPGDSRNHTRTFRLERSGVLPAPVSAGEPVTRFLSRRDLVNRGEEIRKRMDAGVPDVAAEAPPREPAPDDSPVELPYLHRMPKWVPTARDARLRVAKGVVAVALLGFGGWLTLRPLPQATAVPSEPPTDVAVAPAAPPVNAAPARVPTIAPAAIDPGASPRAAADAVAEGRYVDALRLYRSLATKAPAEPAYREAVRILEERLSGSTPP